MSRSLPTTGSSCIVNGLAKAMPSVNTTAPASTGSAADGARPVAVGSSGAETATGAKPAPISASPTATQVPGDQRRPAHAATGTYSTMPVTVDTAKSTPTTAGVPVTRCASSGR